jgi:hypothetical protein
VEPCEPPPQASLQQQQQGAAGGRAAGAGAAAGTDEDEGWEDVVVEGEGKPESQSASGALPEAGPGQMEGEPRGPPGKEAPAPAAWSRLTLTQSLTPKGTTAPCCSESALVWPDLATAALRPAKLPRASACAARSHGACVLRAFSVALASS